MPDSTDLKILAYLKENGRAQWKEIGEAVHMTGQAVAARIERMTEQGIIRRFTVDTDGAKLGNVLTGFISVFMKTSNHEGFMRFIQGNTGILEASRIGGDGCYILKFGVSSQTELNGLLDDVLQYGNYRLNIIVNSVK